MSLISPWRAEVPGILALEADGHTYLDSAATAQKPQAVLDALLAYLEGQHSGWGQLKSVEVLRSL